MSRFTLQLGFWTAVILAFLGTAYQVILADALISGSLVTMKPGSSEGLLAGIYTLLSACLSIPTGNCFNSLGSAAVPYDLLS
jgi:hypothetical protein